MIRGRTDGVDYVGNNFSRTSAAPKDAVKYFVARLRRVAPGAGGGKSGGGGGSAGVDDDEEPEYTLQMTPVGGGRIIDLETRCHALEYDAPAWDGAEDLNDYAVRAAHNDRLLKAFSSAKRQRKVARIQAERKIDASTLADPDAMEATLKAATAGELDARALAALAGERRNIPAHVASATIQSPRTPSTGFRCIRSSIARGGRTWSRRAKNPGRSRNCAIPGTWTISCWIWCRSSRSPARTRTEARRSALWIFCFVSASIAAW